jgi:hypothetical protein
LYKFLLAEQSKIDAKATQKKNNALYRLKSPLFVKIKKEPLKTPVLKWTFLVQKRHFNAV